MPALLFILAQGFFFRKRAEVALQALLTHNLFCMQVVP
jgi:hypothetical protein